MLSATFVAGDALPPEAVPVDGLRKSADERLYAWTTKFKLLKLRFFGSSKSKLKFVSVSIAYVSGGVRR
jgi:hypothetical protein